LSGSHRKASGFAGGYLLAETHRINYRLRSTFFYRKLKEYNTIAFPGLVAELIPVEQLYSWDERSQWGIGEDAFTYIKGNKDFHLFQVFCHPKLLREHPRLLVVSAINRVI